MGLTCGVYGDIDGADWWLYEPSDEVPLVTKRSRKCCSCDGKISVGETARKVRRFRPATDWEECRGLGDEVEIAAWYLCEICGDLSESLTELGFCYDLGDGQESLQQQIAQYRGDEAVDRERLITPNAEFRGEDAAGGRSPGTTGSTT